MTPKTSPRPTRSETPRSTGTGSPRPWNTFVSWSISIIGVRAGAGSATPDAVSTPGPADPLHPAAPRRTAVSRVPRGGPSYRLRSRW
jgi:hypothetical protein